MTTYRELQEQAEKLLADAQQRAQQLLGEAESIRVKERQDNLELARSLIKEYGYTAKELGMGGSGGGGGVSSAKGRQSRSKAAQAQKVVKYRGPNGETWGGGRGRKPGWVQALLAQGKDLEQYRV
ncbi:H-NS family nucleoid-associated regulatory protein [Ramlibacter algicola]|uniref:H-NS histone family protein n=1 Tax=Ramlibacter algicola TaxID=2795217 RepID=A0A934PWW8_9BURK|nr:H-NS histone family protein [Ramlibacter algicola]MBK0391984.1 H-NS histone family protein [Ramlibacter algicola]